MNGDIVVRPLANGADIPLSKDISAEIFVAPYPPTSASRLDIFLFEPQSGAAISDAKFTVKYEMHYMDLGQYPVSTLVSGKGHYQAFLDIELCGGDWAVLDIRVRTGDQGGSVRLGVTMIPS